MQRAIRTVRSRAAEWGVDPAKIGAAGFSAGGELAQLAALRNDAGKAGCRRSGRAGQLAPRLPGADLSGQEPADSAGARLAAGLPGRRLRRSPGHLDRPGRGLPALQEGRRAGGAAHVRQRRPRLRRPAGAGRPVAAGVDDAAGRVPAPGEADRGSARADRAAAAAAARWSDHASSSAGSHRRISSRRRGPIRTTVALPLVPCLERTHVYVCAPAAAGLALRPCPAAPLHRPRPVRCRHRPRQRDRRTGRRRPRRHRDPDQPRHRDRRHHRQRGHRGLSVPQRPRRHLPDRGRDPRVLEGGRAVGDRHRQRPAARRPHHEGRRHRRDDRGDRRAHARERIERPRPGHRPRADRQPAAERPRLRRPRAAQPGRPPVVDQQLARRLVQRQRDAQLAQQLHPRRRRQQLLRHQQPGLLEPGRPGLAGRRRGVQGPDQQLQRRVRPRRRRRHQRHVPQRHQRLPRHRVGVQPQHLAERDRLLQAVARASSRS